MLVLYPLHRCLFEEDINLNCTDNHRRTPAHYAAISNGIQAIRVLAHNDIDINSKDADGCVPTHLAALHNSFSCLQFLITSGLTKIEVRDKMGRTPLHMVCMLEN